MIETNTRIRELREFLKLSREKFGAEIGVSGDVINNLERGRIEIREERIKLICSTYNVNEDWLRHGVGDMFPQRPREQQVLDFVNSSMDSIDSDIRKRFLIALSKLDESDWEFINNIIKKISEED